MTKQYHQLRKEISKNKLLILILVGFVLYLVYDIIHYFVFRESPVYAFAQFAHYERPSISFIKWGICLLGLFSLRLVKRSISWAYLLSLVLFTSVLVFFIEEVFLNAVKKSLVGDAFILEIACIALFVYFHKSTKGQIDFKTRALYYLIAVLFGMGFYFLVQNLPYPPIE